MSEVVTEIDNIPDAFERGLRMLTFSPTLLHTILSEQEIQEIESAYTHNLAQEHEHLVLGPEAERNIEQQISQAYESFFTHLRTRCAQQSSDGENLDRYIEEVQTHVTPRQNIHYRAEVIGVSSAQAKGITVDEKRGTIKIDIATHDETVRDITLSMDTLYGLFKQFRRMETFKDFTDEDVLGLAVRYIIYHELTHSLQAAYANFHGRLVKTRLGASFVRDGRLGNETAPKRYARYGLSAVDDVIESEKQAEGVALDFILLDLQLPPDQAARAEQSIRQQWAIPAIEGLVRLSTRVINHFAQKAENAELDVARVTRALEELFHSPAILSILGKDLSGTLGALRGYAFPHRRGVLATQVYKPLSLPPKNTAPLRDVKRTVTAQ